MTGNHIDGHPAMQVEIVPAPDMEPIVRYRHVRADRAMGLARDLKERFGADVWRVQVRNMATGFVRDTITTDTRPMAAVALARVRKALGREGGDR